VTARLARAFAVFVALQAAAAAASLETRMRGALGDRVLRGARVGVHVVALPSGKALYARDADRAFTPASVMKLLTTAAALDALSPDFRFETRIAARGTVDAAGVLRGDIVVYGGGDPSISGRFYENDPLAVFRRFVAAVRAAGVRSIEGAVVGNAGYFDRVHTAPTWPRKQLTRWYCAPVSALSQNDNCVEVVIRGGAKPGLRCAVTLRPAIPCVELVNRTKTAASRPKVLVHRADRDNRIHVSGGCLPGRTSRFDVALLAPARCFTSLFRERLVRGGVPVKGGIRVEHGTAPRAGERVLYEWRSRLGDAVAVANKRSQNFYAEQILKTLGRERHGEGSFDAGIRAVHAFLAKAGAADPAFCMADGCGLSHRNKVTPRQITSLLRFMRAHRHRRVFLRSLARGGTDGTLAKRFRQAPYRGLVAGKTGYVYGQATLAGYLRAGEREAAFCILVGDFADAKWRLADVHRVQDAMVRAVYDALGEGGEAGGTPATP
jgi:D-alanyl-D-alanine carboxypeptidase/D-alanyl-D-alanine-endopeptidase (penicillin-binding protein 4)